MVTHLINNPNLNDAMKHTQSFNTKLPITLLASVLLASCGGGGGTATITPPVTSAFYGTCGASSTVSQAAAQALCMPVSVPIVTSIPATTYAAGSQEKAAFDYLNNARSTCGFGLLAQDTRLDAAAANHANYQVTNAFGHYETQGLLGFTGVTPTDRAAFVGYIGEVNEGTTGDLAGLNTNSFVNLTRELLSAPYHMRSLMYGWKDVGVSLKQRQAGSAYAVNINPGFRSTESKQQPSSGTVLTYPCQGTVDTATSMINEDPWPIPGRTSAIGQSVLVQVAEGSTLVLNTYAMTRVGGPGIDAGTVANGSVAGNTSPLIKLDWSNDTNSRFTNRYNVAMLMPDKTMMPGGVYRVQVTGTVDGALFNKDFTFSTTGRSPYDTCLTFNDTQLRANGVSFAWTAQYLANQLALVPSYCSGASGGNLVAPTAATLARIF